MLATISRPDVPGKQRRDEIGEMARSVEVFKANGLEVDCLKGEQQAADRQAAERRKSDMMKLAAGFEAAVGEIIETVSSASTELEASAKTLTLTADRSQELATAVAAASEEASTNVQSVSSATEELSSSVNEISRQVQELARMAGEAVDQARNTNDRVSELSKAAAGIGDVVELINTIAGQTNLQRRRSAVARAYHGIQRRAVVDLCRRRDRPRHRSRDVPGRGSGARGVVGVGPMDDEPGPPLRPGPAPAHQPQRGGRFVLVCCRLRSAGDRGTMVSNLSLSPLDFEEFSGVVPGLAGGP